VHDLLALRMPELFTAGVRAHVRLSARFARRADRILTNSEWTRAEVIDLLGVAPERVVATPFGIAERFSPGEPDPERLRARFGISGRYVLSVGTREPRKNLATVVEAFRRVDADNGTQLVLVGGRGWLGDELDAALRASGDRVVVTGFVDDAELVELYRGAACFAFPSLAEGFGFPPLEAMACAAPVISSDRGGLAEVAAGAALIVDPGDAEAVADAMRRVLGDAALAQDLRRRGLERAAGFSWRRCAEQTARAYRDAVASTAS
jgi:alpha-1,3-rhamnosyl/mannosyltransferase